MHVTTGPARYFFLRQPKGVKEEVLHWPPEVKPLQEPDNQVGVAVYLYAEERGWRAELVRTEDDVRADAGGAFVLTRETALGLSPDGRHSTATLELLGVRVAPLGEQGPEYATHLVVRAPGASLAMPKQPLVVPIAALVLAGYLEHGETAEAQLDLRLSASDLASMPPYLPDPVLERAAHRALDAAILSERQRHEIKPEVAAGRVTLYGRTELTTTGDVACEELEHTLGVIEVVDRLIYHEQLMDQVKEVLVAKGYDDLDVRYENGLIELHGTVPDSATIHKLRDLVLRVTGVRGVVVNQLTIAQAAPAVPDADAAAPAADGTRASQSAPANGTTQAKVSETTRG
jgi:osmotically-inducible protein OsmY